MSKLNLIPYTLKRNRPNKTQFTYYLSAAAIGSSLVAISSLFAVQAETRPEYRSAHAQVTTIIKDSPAAKSTLAPLEDSVEVIAKVAVANVKTVDTEKTQEILDKAKPEEKLKLRSPSKDEGMEIVKAVPLPEEIQEVNEAKTEHIASTPAYLLQPSAASLRPQAAPAVLLGSHGSAYPYANVPFPNMSADPWGMYMRQCVSYTAWKVANSGRHMPYWGGRGNAAQWDDNARAAGIPVDYSPRVGSVAVDHSKGGGYGHVSYVEEIYADGTIRVSQFNARWDGTYSEERLSTAGLVFIHF